MFGRAVGVAGRFMFISIYAILSRWAESVKQGKRSGLSVYVQFVAIRDKMIKLIFGLGLACIALIIIGIAGTSISGYISRDDVKRRK